mmetsp:Transcript_10960/g.17301  ORF Transcript_10960/g.17301 Transcript_10960/m.17301 type:complete len:105 (-) Transcript_10960:103-417(-)
MKPADLKLKDVLELLSRGIEAEIFFLMDELQFLCGVLRVGVTGAPFAEDFEEELLVRRRRGREKECLSASRLSVTGATGTWTPAPDAELQEASISRVAKPIQSI